MVNVDTVYQTVQALANKEQRGYLTPQEFNLFANQAQADIFEQYFYDLNAIRAARPEQHLVGDSVQMIMEKLRNTTGVTVLNDDDVVNGVDLPSGRTGRIFVTIDGIRKTLRLINEDEIHDLIGSKWHREAFDEAVYFEDGNGRIQVWSKPTLTFPTGQITAGVECENITGKPELVYWGYTIVNEKPLYDPNSSASFGLPSEERPDLVIKILELAGVSIEDPQLAAYATQAAQQNAGDERI